MTYKILFFFFFTITSFSQPFIEDVKHILLTGRNVFTAPLEWQSDDIIKLAGTLILTSAAYALDNKVKSLADRNNSSFNDVLFEADRGYFIPQAVAGLGGVYLYGVIFKDNEIRRLGLHLGEAIGYASLVTNILESAVGRSRPIAGQGNHDFHSFTIKNNQLAFPSGHTTTAFAFSTVMAAYVDNIYWKAGWYTAAGLVGAARIYHNRHWVSDVILGAAIGHFVADYVVNGSETKNKIELGIIPSGLYLRVAL